MKLYEYEGKELFKRMGIPVPEGMVAANLQEVADAADRLKPPLVLKAQLYTGKRGKGGGILFAETKEEALIHARGLFGKMINGLEVKELLIEEKHSIKKELYAAVLSNPATRKPVVLFSQAGGMDVEEASQEGEVVSSLDINILKGFKSYQARNLIKKVLPISGRDLLSLSTILVKLYDLYRRFDCKLVEINPLAQTDRGILALDAKVEIDDDAVYRQAELGIEPGEDVGDRVPTNLEKAAGRIDENDHRGSAHFVQIDPDGSYVAGMGKVPIGFDGVGTGVSLVTMDELVPLGFYPVNFCDTSGNPTASKLYRATRIIFAQKNIKGYMFNSCISSQQLDNTARGIIKALKEIFPASGGKPDIPCLFVFRGAWDDVAIELFQEHGITDCPWVEVYGRDISEKEAAQHFADLYKRWEAESNRQEVIK